MSDRYPYFQQSHDVVGRRSISALVKCTSAIRQLTYRAVPNSLVEYLQIETWASWGDSGSDQFILLETDALQDLWILHAFFGVAGLNNDINVIRESPL
ncbi:reverse transcriptase domain-containing protein [Tanacetum coccineum]